MILEQTNLDVQLQSVPLPECNKPFPIQAKDVKSLLKDASKRHWQELAEEMKKRDRVRGMLINLKVRCSANDKIMNFYGLPECGMWRAPIAPQCLAWHCCISWPGPSQRGAGSPPRQKQAPSWHLPSTLVWKYCRDAALDVTITHPLKNDTRAGAADILVKLNRLCLATGSCHHGHTSVNSMANCQFVQTLAVMVQCS